MRGCKKHPLVDKSDTDTEWGRNCSGTHLGGTRGYCSEKSKDIEGNLCASREPGANNVKITNGEG